MHKKQAIVHCNAALIASTSLLKQITPANCHALSVLSSFIAVIALTFPKPTTTDFSRDAVSEMVDFIALLRGVKTVISSALEEIIHGSLGGLIRFKVLPIILLLCQDVRCAFDRLEKFNESMIDDPALQAIYARAIQDLRRTFQTYNMISEYRCLVFAWPSHIQESYINQLKRRAPMSLIILAHYGVLLHTVSGLWWSDGRGVEVIEAISRFLDPEWQSAIQWPREIIHKGISL